MRDLPRLKIGNEKGSYMPNGLRTATPHSPDGKERTGKSTLITNWFQEDDYWKNAKIIIDPSGFLAGDCYAIAKRGGAEKNGVHYLSLDHPISINPMMAPYTPAQVSESIAEAVNQVITITTPNQPFTVGMRDISDEAVKWCLSHNRRSLLHVRDYIAAMKTGRAETRDGILARLNYILSDEKMVKILCGNKPINIGELIRNGDTFILDCSGMGREKMIFVGSLVTQAVKNYFRYEKPQIYRPLSLYIDECQNFMNPNIFDILKEGRKYKLSCVLSTQDFAVMDERMTRVMLNVGNIVSYRLGHREASYVAKELAISPNDLQFIEKYHVAYLTPKETGVPKAPMPPYVKAIEPPKMVEPPRKPMKPSWFTLDTPGSYQAA
jgi:type IV secretory pathway TraG/TraD family ATPase VirD4